jgi:hypothetical protein
MFLLIEIKNRDMRHSVVYKAVRILIKYGGIPMTKAGKSFELSIKDEEGLLYRFDREKTLK